MRTKRGVILVMTLWLLVILSLIGLSYSSSVRTNIRILGNRNAKIRATYYARAGIERTIHELLDPMREPYYSHISGWYDDETLFAAQPIGTGFYSLITNGRTEDGYPIYGITDEAARLNINTATEEELLTFPEITQEMASSLIDWRDEDWEIGFDGAEDEYYSMLEDPYYCKNRPFQTVAELLLVRGWTQSDLFGEDSNENGLLDPNEDDGDRMAPLDDADGVLDFGLGGFFTVHSIDRELNPDGEERLALGSASEEDLQQIEGITEDQARSIVRWREDNSFDSLGDLFDVTVAEEDDDDDDDDNNNGNNDRRGRGNQRQDRSRGDRSQGDRSRTSGARSSGGRGSGNDQNRGGGQSDEEAFEFEQVAQLVDWVCIDTEPKRNRVNINTAPYEVLMALPGMTESIAQGIITYRDSNLGPFMSRGDLQQVSGMTEEVFTELIERVTVQSYQFRIIAEGREGDVRAVVEAVVDINIDEDNARILYWNES